MNKMNYSSRSNLGAVEPAGLNCANRLRDTETNKPVSNVEAAGHRLARELNRVGELVAKLEAQLQMVLHPVHPEAPIGANVGHATPSVPCSSLAADMAYAADQAQHIGNNIESIMARVDL